MNIAPGVGDALRNRNDNRAYYIFSGDLNQMGLIYRSLLDHGFSVVKSDVYPGFPREAEEEFVRALKHVFEHRIEGWWGQRENLLKYQVCTEEEYWNALNANSIDNAGRELRENA